MSRLYCTKIEDGRDLLRKILEEDLAQGDLSADPLASQRDFVALSNLQAEVRPHHLFALNVVPFVNGWHWYLVLKGLPPGYPVGLRNNPRMPLPTERRAFEAAKSITIRMSRVARGNVLSTQQQSGHRYFDLFGTPIAVDTDVLRASASDTPEPSELDDLIAEVRKDIEDRFQPATPDASPDIWAELAPQEKQALTKRLATLMSLGRFKLDKLNPFKQHH